MSATILPFCRTAGAAAIASIENPPPVFTRAWADQHLPLIEAALVLLHADDADFADRCRRIEQTEGRDRLDTLSSRIADLGTHLADVADALSLTAERIRTTTVMPLS